MAWTQTQSELAALDCLATASGVKLGSFTYFLILATIVSLMLSLSKPLMLARKLDCPISVLAVAQSVFLPMKIITASSTVPTAGGGLVNPLISVMADLSSLSTSDMAFSRAGIATSRSALASAAMALQISASLLMRSESASTWAFWASAACFSTTITLSSSWHSASAAATTTFLSSTMTTSLVTCSLASSSLARPFSRREEASPVSLRFSKSKDL
mmetsp:Transcript_19208/g.43490  ORF Transcript_19208/g.43490 Transcript_19208/m.43490 type:complete len:215 (-) Transcript_19208:223-867(-)